MQDEEPDFTITDLLTEIGKRLGSDTKGVPLDDGLRTTKEIAASIGTSDRVVLAELYKLAAEGRIEVGRKMVDYGLGPINVRAYRLKS